MAKKSHSNTLALIAVISIIAVVSVSGCVSQGFFEGIFGKVGDIFGIDVVKASRQVSSVGVVNPLTIDRVWTLPQSKIIPETNLQLFMEISNKDTDPSKTIFTSVDLFDSGVMKDSGGSNYCNSYPRPKGTNQCGPSVCVASSSFGAGDGNPCELKSGSTKQITFDMQAPSAEEIANVITKTKLNYRLMYPYVGSTNFEILAVSYDEILRRQKDGKALTTNLIDTKSSGPIKIDVELGTPYVITATENSESLPATVSPKVYIILKLRNAGSGSLMDSKIPKECPDDTGEKHPCFRVYFPKDFAVSTKISAKTGEYQNVEPTSKEDFECKDEGDNVVCSNIKEIDLFKSESEPFQFIINNIKDLPEGVPYRTNLIKAEVRYYYELRGSAEVTIDPTLVG